MPESFLPFIFSGLPKGDVGYGNPTYDIFSVIKKANAMLVAIDKRGSINLPASVRKDLGVGPGTHLELTVDAGGAIVLLPVEIYR